MDRSILGMRILAALALLAPFRPSAAEEGSAASSPAAPRPLALRGNDATEAIHALMVLSHGDVDGIAGIPAQLFHADVAVPDEADAELGRRWSLLIPRALARLPDEPRARAIAALDAVCRAELARAADPRERAVLAEDLLPAPSAVAAIRADADRAFDHGRFADVLLDAWLLDAPQVGTASGDDAAATGTRRRRDALACTLSARGGAIDPADALVEPGVPSRSSAAAPAEDGRGLAVAWSAQRGWLLACDAAGRVLWQYRLDLDADVAPGAGAALVRDSSGLRALDERGHVSTLVPPPGDTRCLGVAGGAAWFATGTRAWRLALGDPGITTAADATAAHAGASAAEVAQLELGAAPVCAPLVRGARSLWLTRDELLLFDLGQRVHRMRHFLDAKPGWRLAAAPAFPGAAPAAALIVSPDGSTWTAEPFAAQLAQASIMGQVRLLTQASRWDDAFYRLQDSPADAASPEGVRALFAIHAGLGLDHVIGHLDAVLAAATTDSERAAVLYVGFHALDQLTAELAADEAATEADRSSPVAVKRRAKAERRRAFLQQHPEVAGAPALRAFLHLHPDVLMSCSPEDFGAPPETWAHAVDGATMCAMVERWTGYHAAGIASVVAPRAIVRVLDEPVADHRAIAPEDTAVVDPQLGPAHLHAGTLIRLERGDGTTMLSCHDAATRRLRWRHRWPADPTVHSRALAIVDGSVLVAEGPSRLQVVDAATGERLLVASSSGVDLLPSQTRVLSRTRVAMLHAGVDRDELVISESPSPTGFAAAAPVVRAERIALPARARWMVPTPAGTALVLLADGRALAYPGADEVTLPQALRRETAPLGTTEGLVLEGRRYPWAE